MSAAKVGSNVDSWCTRCKLMLAHTVEAMVGTKISRVHCNTCNAQHAYRPNPPGVRAASSRTRNASGHRAAKAVPQGKDYDAMMRGRDTARARRYGMQERFAASEVINHPTFGYGLVTSDKGDKIDVLFPDGLKTLAQGR